MGYLRNRTAARLVAGAAALALAAALIAAPQPSSAGISPLQTVIRGQSQWLAGGPASLRIIVTNHNDGTPVSGHVHVALTPGEKGAGEKLALFTGNLARGTADAKFEVPEVTPGPYQLSVQVDSSLGTDLITRPVTIVREDQILLTADKPLYQPGQTVHLRALALRKPSGKPAAGAAVTLEVEDAKGNKVFKQVETCSPYGIVFTDFTLADEVNMGTYTLRAVMEAGRAERTVEVKRYVLPKFKVSVKTDHPWYQPGQRLTGTVQADYFFGKPTSQSDVLITVSTFDVGFHEVGEIKGKTDESGAFKFEAELPPYFVGEPLEQGKAFAKLDIEVTDRAEHTEKITQMVPVAKDPIIITAVPESGEVRPGLENWVYVLLSRPDGSPVETLFSAGFMDQQQLNQERNTPIDQIIEAMVTSVAYPTDALGIRRIRISGTRSGQPVAGMWVAIHSSQGSVGRVLPLAIQHGANSLLLRADQAMARVGDTVHFTVLSTKRTGTTYIDVIRDKQTVLTKAVDLEGGRAEFSLTLTPDLQGTLQVHAYQILPDENIIRDTRLLYVAPANDLVVEVRPDKDTHRPGEPATLRFAVQDQGGKPAQAALGLTIVDESVFALQEMQPGLERVYFALEKELLQPRYEIHGFTKEGILSGALPFTKRTAEEDAARQRAAAVLFAASQVNEPVTLTVNTYQERFEKAKEAWIKTMARDAERIDRALKRYYEAHRTYLQNNLDLTILVDEGLLKKRDLRDSWNRPYRVRWVNATCGLDSAGPDGKWDTSDDIVGVGQWAKDGAQRPRWERGGMAGGGGPVLFDRAPMIGNGIAAALAAPAAVPMHGKPAEPAAPAQQPQVRLRQFFPETMYVNPALITDERGRASVTVAMADSITTWRLQALASSQRGQLGSTSQGLRVFQDFFVDIDLPVALTQNDEISVPVAVYNYLPGAQTVMLTLETEPWFELVNEGAEKSLEIGPSDITVVYFRLRAKGIGRHAFTVHARGSKLSDAIKREIEVLPDGEEHRDTWNDRLEGTVSKQVMIPAQAIDGASTIFVKVYPGLLSQAIEGLDALLRMPFGCFEQTSSVTYPNVLVMNYLKTTKQAKPDVQMKAEQYINVGYQRLLSFEVKGGGFSWFGDAPAHKVLTAYGLLEFRDMSRVHEVDEAVIARTQNWLAGLQEKDGSWAPDKGGIAEGIINRQTGTLRTTAYIAWALAESGYKGPALERAYAYLDEHWQEAKDPYALAVVANAYLSGRPESPSGIAAIEALAKLAVVDDKVAYWRSEEQTFTSARGASADLETTALATYALVKSGRRVDLTNKAITYLIRSKDSYGTWHTTQATVWALKTLLLSLTKAAQEVDATVRVEVNGKPAGSFRITPADYEVVRQVDAKQLVHEGANDVRIVWEGKGSALYQIVAKYYLPWDQVKKPAEEALRIDVDYDRTTLATNDIITATARVVNTTPRTAQMVVIDLGIAPGFEVQTEDFQQMVASKTIKKYTVAARQVIVYLDELAPKVPLELKYRLRAKFPLKAATPASTVYRYYNPEVKATAQPVMLEVR